jgi:hypothetical protein
MACRAALRAAEERDQRSGEAESAARSAAERATSECIKAVSAASEAERAAAAKTVQAQVVQAKSTAALQAARARIESHEEDKASLSAQLAASTAHLTKLMGLVSVVHREPDL